MRGNGACQDSYKFKKSLLISLLTGIFIGDGFAVDYVHRQYIDFQLAISKWKLPEAPLHAGFFALGS
jgi:hypothetical protein